MPEADELRVFAALLVVGIAGAGAVGGRQTPFFFDGGAQGGQCRRHLFGGDDALGRGVLAQDLEDAVGVVFKHEDLARGFGTETNQTHGVAPCEDAQCATHGGRRPFAIISAPFP